MFKGLFKKNQSREKRERIEYREVVVTNSGMHCIWNTSTFQDIVDYDSWEKNLLENEDIERYITKGAFLPLYIHADGVVDVLVRVGTNQDSVLLTEREEKYKVTSSEEYMIDTDGQLGLSGLEFVGKNIGENIEVFNIVAGRYTATVHLIAWDEEPGMIDAEGEGSPNALADFVVLLNPAIEEKEFRKSVETFEDYGRFE